MNSRVKRIAVVSYLGLVGALGASAGLAEHIVDSRAMVGMATASHGGGPAPAFSLRDLDEVEVTLDDLRGEAKDRVVVLEWFDPDCEWVRVYHSATTTVRDLRAEFSSPTVRWAAVYSSTPPEGRKAVELNRAAVERWGIDYPVLLDPDRSVAKLYEVTQSPTVVVIGVDGEIVYRGPIDNTTEPGTPGTVNHLRAALEAAMRGERPESSELSGPGCHLQAGEAIDQH